MTGLLVPSRFNGPADSGNGGYVAGRLASYLPLDATVTVTLRKPVPLEREMAVEVNGDTATLKDGDTTVAEAVVAPDAPDAVPPVDVSTARAAGRNFDGFTTHPYPTCFVCGTERQDNLGIHAGRPDGGPDGTTAAVWEPRNDLGELGPELVWSALDCPGGWAIGLPGRPAVLGRITAWVAGLPNVGERCVVVGALDRWDGRKAFTRTTLYGGDGRELGRAAATWIEIAR